jgi:phosphoribosylanthranilate isomerase
MRDGENIRQVAELGVDWMGMIFWERSPRNVTMIPTIAGIIPDRGSLADVEDYHTPKRVGVFVDEMAQNIITRVVNFQLDLVQFHGHESPTLIRNLRSTLDPDIRPGIQFIKAISVGCAADIAAYKDYADCVDYFLFDTKTAIPSEEEAEGGAYHLPGGSGRQFDWNVLEAYDGNKPFLLSGGIGPDDVERVLAFRHPQCMGIDVNSRFETAPGMKDVAVLKRFLSTISSRR